MVVGFSGKSQSGKNTVTEIWQLLTTYNYLCEYEDTTPKESRLEFVLRYLGYNKDSPKKNYLAPNHGSTWVQKSFAEKLKQAAALLLGCKREDLDDEEFRSKPLGKEWWKYNLPPISYGGMSYLKACDEFGEENLIERYIVRTTPRMVLQWLGTECGREIIHPNIWINALFSKYVAPQDTLELGSQVLGYGLINPHIAGTYVSKKANGHHVIQDSSSNLFIVPRIELDNSKVSKWLISDVRFPNEAKAIKDRRGIIVRIDKDGLEGDRYSHISETILDDYDKFDYRIDNNGSLEELIDKVYAIMIKLNIL